MSGKWEGGKKESATDVASSGFFFLLFFFFCFFLFCFFKLRSRCLHAATGCWWFLGTAKHTLQPLCHRQARSCARYPISSRYFYSQILRSLVACLVMSAYTRSVNMRAHTCTQRACVQSRGGVVESVPRIATHVDKASASTVCKALHVCDRVLYTCHRTDRWTPCRFHFHPYHWPYRRPSVGKGNVVGIGSLFFFRFFSSFFTDRPGSTVAVFFAQLSLVGRRDVLLLYSVTKTTTGTTYHPRLFFAFASSPSRFFLGISFRFSGFCFYSTVHRHAV